MRYSKSKRQPNVQEAAKKSPVTKTKSLAANKKPLRKKKKVQGGKASVAEEQRAARNAVCMLVPHP